MKKKPPKNLQMPDDYEPKHKMETIFSTRPEPETPEEIEAEARLDDLIMERFSQGADVVYIPDVSKREAADVLDNEEATTPTKPRAANSLYYILGFIVLIKGVLFAASWLYLLFTKG